REVLPLGELRVEGLLRAENGSRVLLLPECVVRGGGQIRIVRPVSVKEEEEPLRGAAGQVRQTVDRRLHLAAGAPVLLETPPEPVGGRDVAARVIAEGAQATGRQAFGQRDHGGGQRPGLAGGTGVA